MKQDDWDALYFGILAYGVVIIVALFCAGFFSGYFHNTEFNITKQDCSSSNEAVDGCISGCGYLMRIIFLDYMGDEELGIGGGFYANGSHLEVYEKCKGACSDRMPKECEQVEVDTMLLENVSDKLLLDCWAMHDGKKCLFNARSNEILFFREGVDINWLDENCEATKFTRCGDMKCKNQEIFEYKCQDYTVEVLN